MPVLHDLTQALVVDAVLAFLAFGLMASGIYVLNDLLDLESDRRHHRKRRRPFAAGDISPSAGLAMSVTLAIASLTLSAALLPASFVGVLLAYAALTTAYSVFLKRRAVVDVSRWPRSTPSAWRPAPRRRGSRSPSGSSPSPSSSS